MLSHILLLFAGSALAQNVSYFATSTLNATTTKAGAGTVANPEAFATTMALNVQDLWDLFVGPVTSANITTTVSPTPIPSSSLIPPPFLYYPSFPPGRQEVIASKNESWAFPKDFFFGVAGASFQVEGAADAEGKGPSIWDVSPHRVPGFVLNNATGDITDNHYYLYKQDIARLAAIGVKHYSFSISWARIFPFGSGPVNQLGIDHYNDVVNTCIAYNVTPMITLYHWDLPFFLQNKYGGWLSEQIVGDFTEYARVVFAAYGDRVKHWFTINEPIEVCRQYPLPGVFRNFSIPETQQTWICRKNALLSHAEAYRLGKQMMPDSSITFKNNGGYKIPATNSSADAEAVERAWDFNEGFFADPVYLTGDLPQRVKDFTSAFLPAFTDDQKTLLNGSADYFAHDGYTSSVYFAPDSGISACLTNSSNPLYPGCYNSSQSYPTSLGSWAIGAAADPHSPWLNKATDWVPQFLKTLDQRWKPAGGIAITEFGFAEPFENLKTALPDILFDYVRANYFHDYMQAILLSISEGVNVVGTLAWAFVDNFEWASGPAVRFGLQYVNYTTQERYYKASFFEYVNMYETYVEQ